MHIFISILYLLPGTNKIYGVFEIEKLRYFKTCSFKLVLVILNLSISFLGFESGFQNLQNI